MIKWLVVLAVVLVGCGVPDNRPPETTVPLPAGPPLEGAVLGATRDDWVAARGEPAEGTVGERFNDVEVAWTTDENRARHLELLFEVEQPIGEARNRSRHLLPRDARAVRTYTSSGGQTVEVFTSQALGEVLGADLFGPDQPGTFIVVAAHGSPRTGRVVVEVGNRL